MTDFAKATLVHHVHPIAVQHARDGLYQDETIEGYIERCEAAAAQQTEVAAALRDVLAQRRSTDDVRPQLAEDVDAANTRRGV